MAKIKFVSDNGEVCSEIEKTWKEVLSQASRVRVTRLF